MQWSVLFIHHVGPGAKLRLSDFKASHRTHQEEEGIIQVFCCCFETGSNVAQVGLELYKARDTLEVLILQLLPL